MIMRKYRVIFEYEEEVEANDRWEALITVGSNSRILEHLGSDAIVEEIIDQDAEEVTS